MGKAKKIDAQLTERFSRSASRERRIGVRDLKVFFLIVCEGAKTEPNYFKSFPAQVGEFVYDLQFGGGGISTLKVVEEAIRIRDNSKQKFDRVWAVFDKDSFRPVDFNAAIEKAIQNRVECAWSNEAFELWYLQHFQFRNTPMSRIDYAEAINNAVNDQLKAKSFRYRKNDVGMYHVLQKYGNEEDAIRNARKLHGYHEGATYSDHNPCTTVYKLIEQLRGKDRTLKEEIERKYSQGE